MAPVLPDSMKSSLEFLESIIDDWAANAAAIGLTPTQVTGLTTRLTNARAKLDAATAARLDSKSATEDWHNAFDSMDAMARDLILTIKAFAATTNNNGVYSLAHIPAPASPSPLGPPAVPTDVSAQLDAANGNVMLSWKGSLFGGTQFVVERSVTPASSGESAAQAGPWINMGSTVEKTFTDEAVPAGTAVAAYRIYAQRSSGTSAQTQPVSIIFASQGGTQNAQLKIAA